MSWIQPQAAAEHEGFIELHSGKRLYKVILARQQTAVANLPNGVEWLLLTKHTESVDCSRCMRHEEQWCVWLMACLVTWKGGGAAGAG
jgi:hypothetical protein